MFPEQLALVGKVMDMQLQRQNVISSNISNVKTPGYRPLELDFEKELQDALQLNGKIALTNEKHLPGKFDSNTFSPEFDREFKPRVVHGEDRVNIDKEMAKMAKNNLQYTALSQVITKGFEGINTIIQEGSK